jgi:hypothetical protein
MSQGFINGGKRVFRSLFLASFPLYKFAELELQGFVLSMAWLCWLN